MHSASIIIEHYDLGSPFEVFPIAQNFCKTVRNLQNRAPNLFPVVTVHSMLKVRCQAFLLHDHHYVPHSE